MPDAMEHYQRRWEPADAGYQSTYASGLLGGMLAVNHARAVEDQASPWPLIVGIVLLVALGVVAGWHG